MAARHDANDGLSPRKRLRLGENSPILHHHAESSVAKWDSWSSDHTVGSPNSHCGGHGSSSGDSISLSGSGSESGSQKASPTPDVVNFPVSLTVSMPKIGSLSSSNAVLNTPPVVHSGELRPLLLRPNLNIVEEHSSSAAIVVTTGTSGGASITPWQIQDFEGLTNGFDGSLSGLSDLTGPGYMSDMMEFVKRQSSHQAGPGIVGGENYFQYILMAPTSAAVKLHEEPLTYLNQGQSYEIKCKKLGMEGVVSSRLYRTLVRVGFHDRRQKFQERELLQQWKQMHTTDKLIDGDIPMSFNVFNVKTDPSSTYIEFVWDPTKNTSIFIKVNCISTEFTARKHGGEKGVPFRLQVDTFAYGDTASPESKHLHSAYAQIKVFKTKGADRKNKTDRERAEKRAEKFYSKEKYQPAYDYTILTETFPMEIYEYDAQQQQQQLQNQQQQEHQQQQIRPQSHPSIAVTGRNGAVTSNGSMHNDVDSVATIRIKDEVSSQGGLSSPAPSNEETCLLDTLPADATPPETVDWLKRQRFCSYLKVFGSFSGTDLLRLTRDDLIQICGTADGIRLYNALQFKKLTPKLTLYMCVPGAPAYHAVFLIALNLAELVRKVCDLIQVQPTQIYDVYCQGPDGINVHVNDEVVQNLPDRSRFLIDAMKCGEESECYRILLKSAGETQNVSA